MKIIINFAPNGMLPTKAMTPHVPISVNEIVDDVLKATEAGITMTHLHARDEVTGQPTYKKEIYAKIIEGIRKYAPTLIICASLSGRDFGSFEQRSDVLLLDGDAKPDMGSLTLSSLNFNKQASINTPEMIQALAAKMLERGILPELEAFDSGMINYARYLENKGLIKAPHYFNLIVGNIACAQADLLHVGVMVRDLPQNSLWSIGAIGNTQLPMNILGIAAGGGVRIGLEDNIWFDTARTQLATNQDFLKRINGLINASDQTLMSSEEMRANLNLMPGHGSYGRAILSK
jgi:3-keto-5-aminohexanoate cleavage enzyme